MEYLEIVNREGRVLGLAPRSRVHGDPSLMHRVVHVLIFDKAGRMLLQKRSMNKDVAPGRWDTSVGGHVDPGETLEEALAREMQEELGIKARAEFLYSYVHTNPLETELVHTYRAFHEGPFNFCRDEIDEVRFFSLEEIRSKAASGALSDNFVHEITAYLERPGKKL